MGRIIKNGLVYGGVPVWEGTQAEYDALLTKDSTTIYFISDGVFPPDSCNYSATERVVGTWVDGSTLYEKTIDFGALPNNTIKEVNHNITNIGHIWIVDGFAEDPVTGFTNQLNLSGTSNINSQWYFVVNKTFIRCVTNSDRTAYSVCYVTLRYTKSSS